MSNFAHLRQQLQQQQQQQPRQHLQPGGPIIPPAAPPGVAAGGGAFPGPAIQPAAGAVAEVVPLPGLPTNSSDGATTGGFMSKFQVNFPQTGNDNPARRITSGEHVDSQGWTWRLVLHPWGHDARGCYSAFLELANADSLPAGFSRYVKLEFAMHAWDTAFHQVEPVKTQFLLHKFNAQATDFGYTRAFEHETIMAQRNIFIDPQGFVRISVKIIDVREAYFRVATDTDLARSVTGRGGGGDFADWTTCLPAKSFKHDQLLYVIQKLSELTRVPLVSCRPWLCTPRDYGNGPIGPVRPVAALLPQHLQMTICEALGDRPQYHIYLEEVDTTPEVWARRRAVPAELPAKEAGQLLLAGRAYAQLPSEVFLVFLKIDRRIIAAHASRQQQLALGVHHPAAGAGGQPEFVFIGKAMAHKTDRGCELVPIARNLAHLPETLDLEVYEQIAPEEVRRFSGEKTVAEARLSHGSVLLFRSAQSAEAPGWPARATPQSQAPAANKPTTVPAAAAMSSVVPFNTAAAAAAAAMSAHAAVTHAPKPQRPERKGIDAAVAAAAAAGVVVGNPAAPAPATKVAALSSTAAAAVTPVDPSSSSPSASPSSSSSSSSSVLPTSPLLQLSVASNGGVAAKAGNRGGGAGGGGKNAPGWDGSHMAAATAAAAAAGAAAGTTAGHGPVVMNAEAQKRATYLALFQVQENARQHQVKEAARAVANKLAAEAALAAAKEKHKKSTGGAGAAISSSSAANPAVSDGEKVVAAAKAAAVAAAAAMKAPPPPVLSPSEKAEVAQAARMAAQMAAAEHATKVAAAAATHHSYRTVSIKEALREGAPPSAPAVMNAAVSADIAARQAAAAAAAKAATEAAVKVAMARTAAVKAAAKAAAGALSSAPAAAPMHSSSGGGGGGGVEVAACVSGGDGTKSGLPTGGGGKALSNSAGGAAAAAATTAVGDAASAASDNSGGPEEKIDVDGSTTSTEAGGTVDDGSSDTDANVGGDPTSPVLQAPENEESKGNASRRSKHVGDEVDIDGTATTTTTTNNNSNNNNKKEPPATVTPARSPTAVAIPRATRASRAAAAVAATDEDGDSPGKSESATAAVAAAPVVEIHRRSSRKAAAVAAQNIQTTARAGTRGGGSSASAAQGGGTDGATRSPRAGCGGSDGGGGGAKRRADDGEGVGSRKSAKIEKSEGETGSGTPPASSASSDLSSFISQLMHVPGFTMEKCMELTRSKERAEIASAIKTISHDEKDSFRSRQLERLLAIKEKEAGNDDVGGGGGGGEGGE